MEFSAVDVANTALLLRDTTSGGILILEGPTDSRFATPFLCPDAAAVVAAGKERVVRAVSAIHSHDERGYLGIVDSDFDSIGKHQEPPGVITWDYHDREIMMYCSEALEILVHHMCSEAKVKAFVVSCGCEDIASALFGRAAPLGALRLVSEREGYYFEFDRLKLRRFVDARTLTVDIRGVIGACLQQSTGSQRGLDEIEGKVEHAHREVPDARLLCRGHDVSLLFSIGLRRALASMTGALLPMDVVEATLCASYSFGDFKTTNTYRMIREWERSANGRPLLRTN